MSSSAGPDDAGEWVGDNKWLGYTKGIKGKMDKFIHHSLNSISWKFDNFKFRTMMRTVTTEGSPPQDYTTEQVIEPSSVKMRYRWNKWGLKENPGQMVGSDNRIDEIMQSKCIKNCHDKFWGIFKPRGGIPLTTGPSDGNQSFRSYMKKAQIRNIDDRGPPWLRYWFSCESTLPDQFFVPDPPVQRSAKIFVDMDCTFYSKWFCSGKKIDYS